MMNIESLIGGIDSENMDSSYENMVAELLSEIDTCQAKRLLYAYLDNSDYQVRMLGLRLIKRVVTDREMLEGAIERCFSVDRLTELQRWYSAILARYPLAKLVKKVKKQFRDRQDGSFVDKHIRALQIELSDRGASGKAAIEELVGYNNDS